MPEGVKPEKQGNDNVAGTRGESRNPKIQQGKKNYLV